MRKLVACAISLMPLSPRTAWTATRQTNHGALGYLCPTTWRNGTSPGPILAQVTTSLPARYRSTRPLIEEQPWSTGLG
jgi:hypothetical protein